MDYCVIALGNPGEKYINTRHNIGWIVLDYIYSVDWQFNKYANADIAKLEEGGQSFLLVKPATHMNKSGEVLPFLLKEYKFESKQIIVLHDDIDLPLGRVKISFDRGDGGHNGLKSIMSHLGSKEFIRIRIGISQFNEEGDFIKPNVLGDFSEEEFMVINEEIVKTVQKALNLMSEGSLEKTMGEIN